MRQAYIALYFPSGKEQILKKDAYWTEELSAYFDKLSTRSNKLGKGHFIQAWYSDNYQVRSLGIIKQTPNDAEATQ